MADRKWVRHGTARRLGAAFAALVLSTCLLHGRLGAAAPSPPLRGKVTLHKVIFKPTAGADLRKAGIKPVARYGASQLVEVDDAGLKKLETLGQTQVRDEFYEIRLAAYVIDTRSRRPVAVPPDLSIRGYPAGAPGLYLLQFTGPVQDAWLNEVRKVAGVVRFLNYVPYNAYLVQATPEAMSEVALLDSVQWTGLYQPAYKLSPRLDFTGSGSVDVTIVLVADQAGYAAVGRIKAASNRILVDDHQVGKLIILSVATRPSYIKQLALEPSVLWIEPWSPPTPHDERQGQISAEELDWAGTEPAGPGYLEFLAEHGFSTDPADYPIVDVTDTGFDNGSAIAPAHPDFYELGDPLKPSRIAYVLVVSSDPSPHDVDGHGTINASIVGGYNDRPIFPFRDPSGFQLGLGVSPYGRLASTRVATDNGDGLEIAPAPLLVWSSYVLGARIINNSWGRKAYGAYDAAAREYDDVVRDADQGTPGNQEMTIVFSAGNYGRSGYNTIASPGTAKNVITVGAAENFSPEGTDGCGVGPTGADSGQDIADFSSRGPTDDGRIKPDIVAPGTHIEGAASQEGHFNGSGVCGGPYNNDEWPPDDAYYPPGQTLYTWSSGTSHSAPAVAGAASLVYSYFESNFGAPPSPAMTKAFLVNSARYLSGDGAGGDLPSPDQGWGALDLRAAFDFTEKMLVDQSVILGNPGEEFIGTGRVSDPERPLRATLAWTDPPGALGAGIELVNDLDLELAVDGRTYRGNVFDGEYSAAGGSADRLNNLEAVFLPWGTTGNFRVRVVADNLGGDGVPGNNDATDQDFALVVTNATEVPLPYLQFQEASVDDPAGNGNGHIDPHETVDLTVSIENQGLAGATGVSATLSSTTPEVSVATATAPYPDIPVGGVAANSSPFVITVGALACDQQMDFRLDIATDQGNFVALFSVVVGPGPGQVFTSTDVPVDIPDQGTATSTLSVGESLAISDLDVHLEITHTFDADLDVILTSPAGTTVELFSDVGTGGDDFVNTVLDDEATALIGAGEAPFDGRYRPAGVLSDFDGEGVQGDWTLSITDDAGSDTGTLKAWAIEVGRSFCDPLACTDEDGDGYSIEGGTCGAIDCDDTDPAVHPGALEVCDGVDDNCNGRIDEWGTLVFDSTDVEKAIPDPGTIISTLDVPLSLTIQDVNVELDIVHTYDEDLDVYLTSPTGTRVELFTDVGSGGDNFTGTVLDDEAKAAISACAASSYCAPFSRAYRPEGRLADFDGENARGRWKLEVTDDYYRSYHLHRGTLKGWAIELGACQECEVDDQCDDANPCTDDACVDAGCQNIAVPDYTPCPDGLFCNGDETCQAGVCAAGTPVDCSAMSDQCNEGLCDEATHGCVARPKADGTPCDDADACTGPDTCSGGACAGPISKDSDGDGFIDDACRRGTDCNDADPSVNPLAQEGPQGDPTCSDGVDNDCDGLVDGADPGWCDPASCEVTLRVEDAVGAPDQANFPVGIALDNSMAVRGVEVTLVDAPDELELGTAQAACTARTPGFTCGAGEADNQIRVVVFSTSGDSIAPGSGPVATVFLSDKFPQCTLESTTALTLGDAVVRDAAGNVLVACVQAGDAYCGCEVLGDTNGDGVVDLGDVLQVVDIIVRRLGPTPLQDLCSDVNCDRDTDIVDVIAMVDLILGRIPGPLACTAGTRTTGLAELASGSRRAGARASLPRLAGRSVRVKVRPDGTVVLRNKNEPVRGMEMTLRLRKETEVLGVEAVGRAARFYVDFRKVGPGKVKVVMLSLTGRDIGPGVGPVLKIETQGAHRRRLYLRRRWVKIAR